jgi:hypothetical protein
MPPPRYMCFSVELCDDIERRMGDRRLGATAPMAAQERCNDCILAKLTRHREKERKSYLTQTVLPDRRNIGGFTTPALIHH